MIGSVPPERVSSGRMPSACSNASSASWIAGASGSDETRVRALPRRSRPRRPSGAASRSELLRGRADRVDVLARREADRELAGRLRRDSVVFRTPGLPPMIPFTSADGSAHVRT